MLWTMIIYDFPCESGGSCAFSVGNMYVGATQQANVLSISH